MNAPIAPNVFLNDLIFAARETEKVYRNAALAAESPGLKSLLRQLIAGTGAAQVRLESFRSHLQAPPHRTDPRLKAAVGEWLDLATVFEHSDDEAVREACECANARCVGVFARTMRLASFPPELMDAAREHQAAFVRDSAALGRLTFAPTLAFA